ncbi:hypothetical protein HanRHA438_Chr15g0732101 [Helianthus annuus]|nr:hypothetical protein HanRHA438_Chr15g0732101 [Helianthus annuus]
MGIIPLHPYMKTPHNAPLLTELSHGAKCPKLKHYHYTWSNERFKRSSMVKTIIIITPIN